MKKTFKKMAFWYMAGFLIAILIFPYDSPLNGTTATDNGIFMIIGENWAKGGIPYLTAIDSKGPYIFFINLIGYLIYPGKLGIFILSYTSLFISLVIMSKTFSLLKEKNIVLGLVITVSMLILYGDCINLSESHCLFFNTICIYLFVKQFTDNKYQFFKQSYITTFIFGLCFGVSLVTKPTNGFLIIGLCVYLLIDYLMNGYYLDCLKHIIVFILGSFIIFSIFGIYFYMNNAFDEFIYYSYAINFIYSNRPSSTSITSLLDCIFKFIPYITTSIFLAFFKKNRTAEFSRFVLVETLFCFIGSSIGGGVYHYIMPNIPFLAILLYITYFELYDVLKKKLLSFGVILSTFLPCIKGIIMCAWIIVSYPIWATIKTKLYTEVGEYIKNKGNEYVASTIGYEVEPTFYITADIDPCFKSFTLQDFYITYMPNLKEEIVERFTDDPFKCIVVSSNLDVIDDDIKKIILSCYTLEKTYNETNYKGDEYFVDIYILNEMD